MDKHVIREGLISAVRTLLREDAYLLENDLNERTVAQALATHLKTQFEGRNVDCEYNRNGKLPKRLEFNAYDVTPEELQFLKPEATNRYPDVIVHCRGGNASNVLVVELKKIGQPAGIDYLKLRGFSREPYNYAAAALLWVGWADRPIGTLDWLKDSRARGRSGFEKVDID